MNVDGKQLKAIWIKEGNDSVLCVINQQKLPHQFEIQELTCIEDFLRVIKDMTIRGAGLIGAAAGYSMFIAVLNAPEKRQ